MLNDRARKNLARLLADPSTPYWAVELIKAIRDSDPVDVCNTLEAIVEAVLPGEECECWNQSTRSSSDSS